MDLDCWFPQLRAKHHIGPRQVLPRWDGRHKSRVAEVSRCLTIKAASKAGMRLSFNLATSYSKY